MAETVYPGPVSDLSAVREATCIHTKKIFDSASSRTALRIWSSTPLSPPNPSSTRR